MLTFTPIAPPAYLVRCHAGDGGYGTPALATMVIEIDNNIARVSGLEARSGFRKTWARELIDHLRTLGVRRLAWERRDAAGNVVRSEVVEIGDKLKRISGPAA